LIEIGHVARSHGLRGEVVVVLTTDREERVAPGTTLFTDDGPLIVRSSRGAKKGADRQRWIVQFDAVASREAADALRGKVLRAEPLDDPDTLWAHEVVGSEVVLRSDNQVVGSCVAVLANPAADLLELDTGALVPAVFVVDRQPGRVIIDPPEGLLDL
jgi:16S rRNA processing protein RimM